MSSRPAMFQQADLERFDDIIQDAVFELMVNHNVSRKEILRRMDDAIEVVEYQIGPARDAERDQ